MITTKKMDTTRDSKKAISRFTKQSALGKSKLSKEKIKRLSFVRREKPSFNENKMGCLSVSNRDSGKKHKILRKCSDDRKAVNHSSVPRKLRSAMKKRSSGSLFPPLPRSKKLNHSYQNQQRSHQSPRLNLSDTITKDEEEVVETLYLLAGMLSQNDSANRSGIQDGSSSAADEVGESPTTVHEDSKEAVPSSAAQNACFSAHEERSSLQITDSINQTDSRTCQEMDYLTTPQHHEDPGSAAIVNPPTLLLGCVIEQINDKFHSAASFGTSTAISEHASLKLPKENDDSSLYESKLEHEKALEPFAGKELKRHHGNVDCKHHGGFCTLVICFRILLNLSSFFLNVIILLIDDEGSLRWSSLSPATSKDSGRSFAVSAPPLPGATLCSVKKGSAENGFSVAKVKKNAVNKMPWKRCAAHIYICHVIQALKSRESNDAIEHTEVGRLEELKQGVYGQTSFRGLRNVWNGLSLCSKCDGKGDFSESRNSILPEKSQNQDLQLAYSANGDITVQRQSFDFLSLSTGNGRVKSSLNGDELGAGNWYKGHLQLHVSPHVSSIKHQHTDTPQATSQSHYSVAYDQLSAASKQLQPALYPISSSYSMLHKGSSILTKDHQYQQMQLAAELATRVKHVGDSTLASRFPTVQNSRTETFNRIPCSQTLSPPYIAMHKVQGDSQMCQQHQQLIPSTLVLSTVMRRPEHHKLSYEEKYPGFQSSSTLPLQLLCNERL